jgi:hypothetical protein
LRRRAGTQGERRRRIAYVAVEVGFTRSVLPGPAARSASHFAGATPPLAITFFEGHRLWNDPKLCLHLPLHKRHKLAGVTRVLAVLTIELARIARDQPHLARKIKVIADLSLVNQVSERREVHRLFDDCLVKWRLRPADWLAEHESQLVRPN